MRKKGESGFERTSSEESNRRKRKKRTEGFLITVSKDLDLGIVNSYRRRSSHREDSAIPNGMADHHLLNAIEAQANRRAEPDVWGADES